MRTALRLIVCVIQAGAFTTAPAVAADGSQDRVELQPRGGTASVKASGEGATGNPDAAGVGTATLTEAEFQRAAHAPAVSERSDAADHAAARRAAEEREREDAFVRSTWTGP